MKIKKRGFVMSSTLIGAIACAVLLAILALAILILKDKDIGWINYIKNLFRFG